MKIFLLFIILLFLIHAEDDFTKVGTPYYVMTEATSLNLRDAPEKGKVIAQLLKNEKVTLLKKDYSEPMSMGWDLVKTSKGKEGYVSKEFLSRFPLDALDSMPMIQYAQSSTKENQLTVRPLLFKIKDRWMSGGIGDSEPVYVLKKLANLKTSLTVISSKGTEVEKTKILSTSKAGCQEYIVGDISKTQKMQTLLENEVLYVLSNVKVNKEVKRESTLSKEQLSILQKEADTLFKKNKIKDAESKKFQLKEMYLLNSGAHKFASVRYYITNENSMETKNLYILFDLQKNKLVFSEFQELSKDQIGYGGNLHLEASFELEGLGLIFIFQDIGFDASIKRIMKLQGEKLILVGMGGGDAC
jgi:hypothetical protein